MSAPSITASVGETIKQSVLSFAAIGAEGGGGSGAISLPKITSVSGGGSLTLTDTAGGQQFDPSGTVIGLTESGINSGKWYWEVEIVDAPSGWGVGVAESGHTADRVGSDGSHYGLSNMSGNSWVLVGKGGGDFSGAHSTMPGTGGVFMFALDMDNEKVYLGRDGTWYDSNDAAGGDPAAGTGWAFDLSSLTDFSINNPSMLPGFGFSAGSGKGVYRYKPEHFSHAIPAGFNGT